MKTFTINLDAVALESRRSWGQVKPFSRPFKSKKDYNRKDKSWRREAF